MVIWEKNRFNVALNFLSLLTLKDKRHLTFFCGVCWLVAAQIRNYFNLRLLETSRFLAESMRIVWCTRNRVPLRRFSPKSGEFAYSREAEKPPKRLSKFRRPLGKLRFDSTKVKNDAGSVHPSHAVPGGFRAVSFRYTHCMCCVLDMCEMRFLLISSAFKSATRCTRHRNALTSLWSVALFATRCAHLC